MSLQKHSSVASAVLVALFGLTACGGGSGGGTTTTPPTTSTNSAPTDITLSNNEVAENTVAAAIGNLTATDADSAETFSFAVDDARFVVNNGELQLAANTALDFEIEANVAINVTVTDSGSNTFSKAFTINVADILEAPTTYTFESRFEAGSSVSYGGQVARQVLISDLFSYIGQLKADIDNNVVSSKAEAVAKMTSYYHISTEDYETVVGDRALMLSTGPGNSQTSMIQISSSHKDLFGKIAGQDATGQHRDWSTSLVGWNDAGSITPDGLAVKLIDMIGDNVQTYIGGTQRFDPQGNVIADLYVTEDGVDLKQLLQKFLLSAVAFSQAADDYLDDDIDGKGLNSDNTIGDKDGTKPYTALEHSFDEGFGYFGAARNYNEYTDAEIAAKGGRDDWQKYHDSDGNGSIDLTAEYNFGNSTNAAKRDLGSADNPIPTDFSKAAFDAFLMGRAIITDAAGALTDEQMTALQAQRDIALDNWEKSIASTVVHYINETISDIEKLGSSEYDFATAAKHWSELKGFAFAFQFNSRSPVTAEQFAVLHGLIGMKSVGAASSADDIAAYKAQLLLARELLRSAYDFDVDNVTAW